MKKKGIAVQVLELLQHEKIRSAIRNAESPEEAAKLLLSAAGHEAARLDVKEVAHTLASFEKPGAKLSEADLLAVAGSLIASGEPNTGGHTQCCYHCYTK